MTTTHISTTITTKDLESEWPIGWAVAGNSDTWIAELPAGTALEVGCTYLEDANDEYTVEAWYVAVNDGEVAFGATHTDALRGLARHLVAMRLDLEQALVRATLPVLRP